MILSTFNQRQSTSAQRFKSAEVADLESMRYE